MTPSTTSRSPAVPEPRSPVAPEPSPKPVQQITDGRVDSAVGELVAGLLETGSTARLLTELADITSRVLSASCGVTTHRDDRSVTVASSDPPAAAVDQMQYDLGRGPCLQPLATGQTVIVPNMTDEIRWQPFPARVLPLGVISSLSLRWT